MPVSFSSFVPLLKILRLCQLVLTHSLHTKKPQQIPCMAGIVCGFLRFLISWRIVYCFLPFAYTLQAKLSTLFFTQLRILKLAILPVICALIVNMICLLSSVISICSLSLPPCPLLARSLVVVAYSFILIA